MTVVRLLCTLGLVLWAGIAGAAAGQQAYGITYGQAQGLDAGEIGSLAQDSRGFIWIGANGGLVRFDGLRFERWAPDVLPHLPTRIATGNGGRVVVETYEGQLFALTGHSATPLLGPDEKPLNGATSVIFDASDHLWVVGKGGVLIRDSDDRWRKLDAARIGGQTPLKVKRLGDAVAVLTDKAVWRLDAGGSHIVYTRPAATIVQTAPDTDWVLDASYRLWRVQGRDAKAYPLPRGRVMSLAARDQTLWVAIDRYLVAFGPDGSRRVMGPAQGIASGGPLLVDREDGLWLGTFVGLQYFSEPDTRQWTQAEGLVSNHLHQLAILPHSVWAASWQGVASLDSAHPQTFVSSNESADNSLCGNSDIGVFYARGRNVWRQAEGAPVRLRLPAHPPDLALGGCLRDASGALWLATDAGLYEQRTPGARWRLALQSLPGGDPPVRLAEDPAGGLWLFNLHHLCRYRPETQTPPARAPLDCLETPPNVELRDGTVADNGALLLATSDGVYRFAGRRFERILLSRTPISLTLENVIASPRGGYWIVGPGIFQRIVVRPHAAIADVVEQPSIRQGLPGNEAVDMVETTAGDLWIAGNRGLFRVPAAVRRLSVCPRRVVVVGTSIDGVAQPDRQPLVLEPGQHQLTISISALSYKDPAGVMYRYRTDPKAPWSAPSTNAVLQFIDPDAGRHAVDVTASVDGVAWAPPTRMVFRVRPHWWASLWAWAAYALVVTALLVVAYRLRTAHLLSLERQRLRIAMDLHDEIGSNLGSIGLLAGEAARHAGDRERLPHLIGQITSLAQLTHVGLRLVGHNLKSDHGALTDLARDIRVQVKRLIHEDELDLRFVVAPQAAQLDISSSVHRHALMIVVEAVHNALKYAAADALVITLSVISADRWQLIIADDGRGFDPATARGAGSGLENMNRRTHEAGGVLDLETAPGGGTRISIVFPARIRRRPLSRLPDSWIAWLRRKAGLRSDSGAEPW